MRQQMKNEIRSDIRNSSDRFLADKIQTIRNMRRFGFHPAWASLAGIILAEQERRRGGPINHGRASGTFLGMSDDGMARYAL